MYFTVSRHAMWGFKVSFVKNENRLVKSMKYKIFIENEICTYKDLNKCNEFINSEIQGWIVENGLDKYEKRRPPKFCVHMKNSETIVLGERIR